MADVTPSKVGTYLGIVASIVAIGGAIYYLAQRQKNVTAVRQGVKFRKRIQPNRDATLGHAGASRKFLGSIARSSATGAGAAANLPPRIGKYKSPQVQRNTTRGTPTNRQTSTNVLTTPFNRRNTSRRATVAAVLPVSSSLT
jgi:hypothetical protein